MRRATSWFSAVVDNGPGIPPDQLENVLKPFYRLEGSRNRSTGGTGLGLAIAHQLAMAMGGGAVAAQPQRRRARSPAHLDARATPPD
jgi:signal transduction histidine kinase